jgi:hypothetical protein
MYPWTIQTLQPAVTVFFATNGKLFVPTFNCSRANVKRLVYSSNFVFKHPSTSAGCEFVNGVLNTGGSDKGEGGGNDPMTS